MKFGLTLTEHKEDVLEQIFEENIWTSERESNSGMEKIACCRAL
jgi:hypothetical protein